jgi:GAF domain-containing protein
MMEKEELEKSLSSLSILYSTAAWRIKAETEDGVLKVGLDRIVDLLKPEIGAILLLSESGNLKIASAVGLPRKIVEKARVEIGTGLCGEVFLTGRPIIVNDFHRDPSFIDPFVRLWEVKTSLCYPLRVDEEMNGVIYLARLSDTRFTKEEEWLVALVAERIDLALQIMRLKKKIEE